MVLRASFGSDTGHRKRRRSWTRATGGLLGNPQFLEQTGQSLQKLNIDTAGKILSGQITMFGADLDTVIVHKEQSQVQTQLNALKQADPDAYETAIKEINALANPDQRSAVQSGLGALDKASVGGTDAAFDAVLPAVGPDIDFRDQSDREAAGAALVQHVRATNGCDVAGTRVSGCH